MKEFVVWFLQHWAEMWVFAKGFFIISLAYSLTFTYQLATYEHNDCSKDRKSLVVAIVMWTAMAVATLYVK